MSTATALLDATQLAFFQRHGYLLPGRKLLPDADFAELQATFEGMLAQWTAHGGRPEAMDVPHFYYPKLMRWLLHPAVLDLVESLIGPDILLFTSHFICKPAGDGRRVPWHEDSAYWRGQWDPMEVVTIWLAIDESTPENGCMQVIPGSHAGGYSEYVEHGEAAVFTTEIMRGSFDPATAVSCILQPNEFSLHHARMIHGSKANTSARRRCGYTMRYINAAARFVGKEGHPFQVYQARGRNIAGNTLGDPSKPFRGWIDRYGWQPPKGH